MSVCGVQVGSTRVAVTSLASVEAALGGGDTLALRDAKLAFIWNCGRCGSTLLHKALGAMPGTISLSEPFWLEQMCFNMQLKSPDGQAACRRALLACVGAEVRLLRKQSTIAGWSAATTFAFNPKASGHDIVGPAAADALPNSRHACAHTRGSEPNPLV